jgi:hypothetical protein
MAPRKDPRSGNLVSFGKYILKADPDEVYSLAAGKVYTKAAARTGQQ